MGREVLLRQQISHRSLLEEKLAENVRLAQVPNVPNHEIEPPQLMPAHLAANALIDHSIWIVWISDGFVEQVACGWLLEIGSEVARFFDVSSNSPGEFPNFLLLLRRKLLIIFLGRYVRQTGG